MLSKIVLALLALVVATLALPGCTQSRLRTYDDDKPKCPKVRILGIRGTTEDYPYGELKDLVTSIKGKLDDVDDIAVDYPASGIDLIDGQPHPRPVEYALSERAGIENFTQIMIDSVEDCPDIKLVLLGYSQGAQVIGDTLCGRSSFGFGPTLPIDSYFKYNVRGIIQLGDPTNVKDLPWHKGTATRGGIFPRPYWSACSGLADYWQSWCDEKDIFCASEGNITAHTKYVKKYTNEITDFVVETLKKDEDNDSERSSFDLK